MHQRLLELFLIIRSVRALRYELERRPEMLFAAIDALLDQGARDLVIVNNNAGNGETGLAALLKAGRVRTIICSFPRQADSQVFDALYHAGKIELELVPQGNLAERIRAAGAGIGGFYTPTAVGTPLADGKVRRYNPICSLLITQGCKFSCSYCPIPAVNQKTWRFRSPVFAELKDALGDAVIFDGRNLYAPDEVEAAGVAYYGIGRGRSIRLG